MKKVFTVFSLLSFRKNTLCLSSFILFYFFLSLSPAMASAKHIISFSIIPQQHVHNDKIDSQQTYGLHYTHLLSLTPFMDLLIGATVDYTDIKSDDSASKNNLNQYSLGFIPRVGLSFPIYKNYIALYSGLGAGLHYENLKINEKRQENFILDGQLFTGIAFKYSYFYSSIEYVFSESARARGITLSIGVII